MAILGIDLGATKISYALFDHKGKIIIRGTSMVEKLSGQITGAILISIIREMNRDAIELNEKVEAIGICVPGIAFKDSGTVWAPNIAGWEKFPLLKNIRDSLENDSIPVVIESDRACHILGEHWRGAAQIIRNGIYLAVGTGIGAGIMVEGEILRGSGDISGAIGWMALNTPYDKKYDQCGCLEYYASGGGIERLFKKKMQEGNYSG
ncbi:MAG: ROK family protein, partial [Cyclobacteriaceae bacterium]|nr:ROK family protein [Cyclobacteriaceae bacterium]